MIKGIGIDLIQLNRIKQSLDKSGRLAQRILTDREYDLFNGYTSEKRKIEFLAGRFAAKEAFAKATGRGIGKLSFKDIEVLSAKSGAPILRAIGYENERILISISHSDDYAIAQVVIG